MKNLLKIQNMNKTNEIKNNFYSSSRNFGSTFNKNNLKDVIIFDCVMCWRRFGFSC